MIIFNFGNVSTPQNLQQVLDTGNRAESQQINMGSQYNEMQVTENAISKYFGSPFDSVQLQPGSNGFAWPTAGAKEWQTSTLFTNALQAENYLRPPQIGAMAPMQNFGLTMPYFDEGYGEYLLPISVSGGSQLFWMRLATTGTTGFSRQNCFYATTLANWNANIRLGVVNFRISGGFPEIGGMVTFFNGVSWVPFIGFAILGYPESPYQGQSFGYFVINTATGRIDQKNYRVDSI